MGSGAGGIVLVSMTRRANSPISMETYDTMHGMKMPDRAQILAQPYG